MCEILWVSVWFLAHIIIKLLFTEMRYIYNLRNMEKLTSEILVGIQQVVLKNVSICLMFGSYHFIFPPRSPAKAEVEDNGDVSTSRLNHPGSPYVL